MQRQKYTRSPRLTPGRSLARQTAPVSISVASLLLCKQRAAAQRTPHSAQHSGRRVCFYAFVFILVYQTWPAPHPLARYPVTSDVLPRDSAPPNPDRRRQQPTHRTPHCSLRSPLEAPPPGAVTVHIHPARPPARPLPPWTRATSPSRSPPSSPSCTPSSTKSAFPARSATLAKQR
jgi:hypothetical protein